MRLALQSAVLSAALCLVAAAGCDRDDPEGARAAPTHPPLDLRETATPGEHYTIAEITTLEYRLPAGSSGGGGDDDEDAPPLELVHEIEIGKQIEVDVVQVAPDAQPVRYRKRFVHFRQRNTTRLADAPPRTDAEAHPVEGHTLEYVFGDGDDGPGRWQVRWVDGPGGRAPEAMPQPMSGRGHPWLPQQPVRPGDSWQTSALPFSLPGVADEDVTTTLTLSRVERAADGARVAHVAIAVDIDGEATSGRLEGAYRMQIAQPREDVPGRMVRVQLAGRVEQPAPGSADDAPPVQVEMVVYRAVE